MTKSHFLFLALALTITVFSLAGYAQTTVQSSDSLNARKDFLAASQEKVIRDYNLKPLDSSQELERIILEEMGKIDKVAGFKTPVWKTTEKTFSHPVAGIGVSLDELKDYAGRANIQQLRQYITFILAHEKTHILQYQKYPDSYLTEDMNTKRLLECQADILGGKLLTESQGEPDEKDREAVTDALQVAFVMGTEQFSDVASHPSREERRTAVRLGMSLGTMVTMSNLPPTPQLKIILNSLAEKINILPGEDWMGWSWRTAKRITRYNRAASKDIILVDNTIDWDESSQNPFVNYDYTYKNIGFRTIEVDMEFQCNWVLRENSNDTLRWQKWSVKNYKFKLAPGQQFKAEGSLIWGSIGPNMLNFIDLSKLMPKFVAPIENSNALVSFEYADSTEFKQEADKLKRVINTLIDASRDDFKKHWGGAGKKILDSTVYPSSTAIPGAAETSIWVSNEESSVEASVYKGGDSKAALKSYNEFVAKLQVAFSDNIGEESPRNSASSEGRYYSFQPNKVIKADVEIAFAKQIATNSYTVKLSIQAPPSEKIEPPIVDDLPRLVDSDYKDIAQKVLNNFVQNKYNDVRKDFNTETAKILTAEWIAETWTAITNRFGSFKKNDDAVVGKEQGADAVFIRFELERVFSILVVMFDKEGKINGLWLRPTDSGDITEAQTLTYKNITQKVLDSLLQKKYEDVRKDFNPEMAELTAAKIEEGWTSLTNQIGSFKSNSEPVIGKEQGFSAVYIKCEMERGKVLLVVMFDKEEKISGLWYRPIF